MKLCSFCFIAVSWMTTTCSATFGSSFFSNNDDSSSSNSNSIFFDSFVTVDPSKIVSMIESYHGADMLLSEDMQEEIDLFIELVHIEESKLNLFGRELILNNVSLSLPKEYVEEYGDDDALHIDRVYIKWDNYMRPPFVLDVEVENIDVLVDFYNIMLSRSNWHELMDMAVPVASGAAIPTRLASRRLTKEIKQASLSPASSDVVRLNKVSVSGDFTTQIRLNTNNYKQELGRVTIENMNENMIIQSIISEIEKHSENNYIETKQKGCTMDQLFDILNGFFTPQQITQDLMSVTTDNTKSKLRGGVSSVNKLMFKQNEIEDQQEDSIWKSYLPDFLLYNSQ